MSRTKLNKIFGAYDECCSRAYSQMPNDKKAYFAFI